MSDLLRKPRPDDVLGNLPQEQKDRITCWLGEFTYSQVLKKIAAPPPEGLGLQVQYTTLRRFYAKNLPHDLIRTRRAEMIRLRHYGEIIDAEPAPYDAITKECFQKHLFYQSLSAEYHGEKFRKNMELMLKLRALELKEKHLELEQARLEAQSRPRKAGPNLQILAAIQAEIASAAPKILPDSALRAPHSAIEQPPAIQETGEPTPHPHLSLLETDPVPLLTHESTNPLIHQSPSPPSADIEKSPDLAAEPEAPVLETDPKPLQNAPPSIQKSINPPIPASATTSDIEEPPNSAAELLAPTLQTNPKPPQNVPPFIQKSINPPIPASAPPRPPTPPDPSPTLPTHPDGTH